MLSRQRPTDASSSALSKNNATSPKIVVVSSELSLSMSHRSSLAAGWHGPQQYHPRPFRFLDRRKRSWLAAWHIAVAHPANLPVSAERALKAASGSWMVSSDPVDFSTRRQILKRESVTAAFHLLSWRQQVRAGRPLLLLMLLF